MATETYERIRTEAQSLTMAERADLIISLLESLNETTESGVEKAWAEEIMHRATQVSSGQARLLEREDFKQKLRARSIS